MSETRCRVENCPVAQTGECLEGFSPPKDCPNFLKEAPEEDGQPAGQIEVEAIEPDEPLMEFLPKGESLVGSSLVNVTHRAPCPLVVIAGPVGSGKTTLLVGLYEAFQRGPFADFNFAGSQTLRAFEERCHLSRIASGRAEADTARTPRAQSLPFLHLALRKDATRRDLLLSDLSGEAFDDVVNSLDSARGLTELERADHLLLMLDGARLTDPAQRQAHLRNMGSALRSLIQVGALRPPTVVHLVVSKWDQAVLKPNHMALIEHSVERLQAQLGAFEVVQHEVAARSGPGSTVSEGHGLAGLLRLIAKRRRARHNLLEMKPSDPGREYLRYGNRQALKEDNIQ